MNTMSSAPWLYTNNSSASGLVTRRQIENTFGSTLFKSSKIQVPLEKSPRVAGRYESHC
jgi:hypothetical protein